VPVIAAVSVKCSVSPLVRPAVIATVARSSASESTSLTETPGSTGTCPA
jgi:hypothetical protein